MEAFTAFAKEHGIKMNVVNIPNRTGGDSDWNKTAVHFRITMTIEPHCTGKARTLWSGEYSQGVGIAESWARKNKSKFSSWGHFNMRDALQNPLPYGKRYRDDSAYYTQLKEVYGKHAAKGGVLEAGEILLSLQMDIMGADQHFADWAGDLGYSDDSLKARKIWDAVNDTRRDIIGAMPSDVFAQFEGLEE